MFSTYVWPYNFSQSEYQQFNYYAPTMMSLAYSGVPQTLFPISLTSRVEIPETQIKKINIRKKHIGKQQKLNLIKEDRKILDQNKNSQNEYTSKFQNAQRNLLSNLLHHLVSFIMKNPQFKQIIEKIIATHHLNITCSQVIQFVSKIRLRSYIKVTSLQDLWSRNNQSKDLAKALRIFSYYFLKQKSYLLVCDSRRIKSGTKIQHLTKIRSLIRLLFLS